MTVVGPDQFDVVDTKGLSQFIERYHCRIPPAALQATEILLTEAGTRLDFLLGQALLTTQAGEVPADQFAHIHALEDRDLHTLSLSTIVCKRAKLRNKRPVLGTSKALATISSKTVRHVA